MSKDVQLQTVYLPSPDIVARDIEGELIIVPLTAGIGDMEDELYTLNETGRAVWQRLDGRRTLRAVAEALVTDYEAPVDEIERDVLGLVAELAQRGILVEA